MRDEGLDLRTPGEAVEALVKIGEPAVGPLTEALKSKNEGVRLAAKEALEKIRTKKS